MSSSPAILQMRVLVVKSRQYCTNRFSVPDANPLSPSYIQFCKCYKVFTNMIDTLSEEV
jgi:hypothetical protein